LRVTGPLRSSRRRSCSARSREDAWPSSSRTRLSPGKILLMESENQLELYLKNTLFVRNLSVQVNEAVLREVFGECDEIVKVSFKPFPGSQSQFFAVLDFATSKGVAEGSKLSGSSILGVPCACSVIDPIEAMKSSPGSYSVEGVPDQGAMDAEYIKRLREAHDDHRFRTVHVAGLPDDANPEGLRRLCANFGEVECVRMDKDETGAGFGLVEFKERGPAAVCKKQREFLVDGQVLQFLEAKALVNEVDFAEKGVHFQSVIHDAYNMRSVVAQGGGLAEKLEAVRLAALSLFGQEGEQADGAAAGASSGLEGAAAKVKKKKKKEKKEKKDKDKAKGSKKEKRREKAKAEAEGAPRSRSASPGAQEAQGPGVDVLDEDGDGEEEGGLINLDDDEIEVVPNTELLVLGSSSSSSSSDSEDAAKGPGSAPTAVASDPSAAANAGDGTPGAVDDAEERIKRLVAQLQCDSDTSSTVKVVLDEEEGAGPTLVDEEDEGQKRRRLARERAKYGGYVRVVSREDISSVCHVPGCVRRGGHMPPHVDAAGLPLIYVKNGNVEDEDRRKAKGRRRSASRSRRRKRKRS